MKHFNYKGQLLRGKHAGKYFTELSENYRRWASLNLDGFNEEISQLDQGKMPNSKASEKRENEQIRGMRSSSGNGGMKSIGLDRPGQKKFTSRSVRPQNFTPTENQ